MGEHHHLQAKLVPVEQRHVLLDVAGAFQLFDAPPAGRLRNAGAGGDFGGGQRGIRLQDR
jgi:hypothetical protein